MDSANHDKRSILRVLGFENVVMQRKKKREVGGNISTVRKKDRG